MNRPSCWHRRLLSALRIAAIGAGMQLTGCQQKMADQPGYRPLEADTFFDDGRSARPLVEGVIEHGRPLDSDPRMTGLIRETAAARSRTNDDMGPNDVKHYVDAFPFPITIDDVKRGQQRYTIFCAVCHDPIGTGNGKIVERGYVHPPSFHTDDSRGFLHRGVSVTLREAPIGYFFEVISRGYGAMPDYSSQVPPDDRWRIVAYIRALQLSQRTKIDELPEEVGQKVREKLEGTP